MKKPKTKYLITYYKCDDMGFINEYHVVLDKEQTAKKMYKNISSEPDTINIEMEVL